MRLFALVAGPEMAVDLVRGVPGAGSGLDQS